ncbi:hypothetical protein B0H14DRAFT_1498816 [Mycena olivaceomarginata]|nr:hypothetical protein B0H14DRAFT_1498816 [Mycena olivaceomarginata]
MSPYARLSAIVALAFAATATAVSNVQLSSPTPGSNATITWSSDSSDNTPLTLAIFSDGSNQTFAGGLAIANTVNPQDNKITILFPEVISPGSYVVSFISASNTTDVLATSPSFTVGAAASAAPSASATRTGSASGTSGTATAPGASASASNVSNSLSSAASSISAAASSAASSARSVASSALSSLASAASSAASSGASTSPTTGAARALTPMWSSGASLAVAMVLGGVAVGAVAL